VEDSENRASNGIGQEREHAFLDRSLELGHQEESSNSVVGCSLCDLEIEFEFVHECLDRPHVERTLRQ
jgi:hypothetical protein